MLFRSSILEVISMADRYIEGATVILEGQFKNWAGEFYNPTDVKLKVYKEGREQIGTTIEGDDIINDSVGIFQAKYTLPVGVSSIVYEFSGLDGDGLIQLSRKRIEPIWAE